MLVTSLALLPSFLAGEEMDLLVKVVRQQVEAKLVKVVKEQVEAMEERMREVVLGQVEVEMQRREVLIMERLEEILNPRREKRQHVNPENTEVRDSKDVVAIHPTLSLEPQTNGSAANVNDQLPFSEVIKRVEVKLMNALSEQKSFLLNTISEKEKLFEEKLVDGNRRDQEVELDSRIDEIGHILMQNITDQSEVLTSRVSKEIVNLNSTITKVGEDSKAILEKIENLEKEIEGMEEKMEREKTSLGEQLNETEHTLGLKLTRMGQVLGEALGEAARQELDKENALVRKELAERKKNLKDVPRLATCVFQGAWNTSGTVNYSTSLIDSRWSMACIHQINRSLLVQSDIRFPIQCWRRDEDWDAESHNWVIYSSHLCSFHICAFR